MLFKLTQCITAHRFTTKRVKERSLEEALQTLRKIPPTLLHSLEPEHHRRLVQLILSTQLGAANTPTSACRKLDQVTGWLLVMVTPVQMQMT